MKSAFGKNLKALREMKGLTQRELANLLNITHVTLINYENNGAYPQREEIKKALLKQLDCTERELYGYSDGYYETHIFIEPAYNVDDKKCSIKSGGYTSNLDKKTKSEKALVNLKNNKIYKINKLQRAIDTQIVEKYNDGYFIKNTDDSMDRFIPINSYVYVSKETNINLYNNHVCAITLDGYSILFRRITFLPYDELITLVPQSTNNKYKSETISIKNNSNFKILGQARWFSNDGGRL